MKPLILFLLLLHSIGSHAHTVTAFNLQWFGNGGELQGNSSDEYRMVRIKDFMEKSLSDTDIYAFSEVTNVPMLRQMMTGFNCYSHRESNLKLQHLAICTRENFTVEAHTIEEVRLGIPGMRPALVAKITDDQGFSFNVVTVHLKASTHNTDRRLEQVLRLLNGQNFVLPTMIIGDFNTYPKEKTDKEMDDDEYISQLFAPFGFNQVEGDTGIYTYIGRWSRSTLDRAWVKDLLPTSFKVVGPCNREDNTEEPYSKIAFYKRFISDHCALSIQF